MRSAKGYCKQTKPGIFDIKLSLGKDVTGKYQVKTFRFRGSRPAAVDYFDELKRQYLVDSYVKPSKITVAEYLTRWLKDYAKPNLTARSYERYESIVKTKLIPAMGNIALAALRPEHLQKHYAALLAAGLSPRTVHYSHIVCHKALATALKWQLVNRNAADAVDVPKAHPAEMQTWDSFEMGKFLEAAKDSPYYALFYAALFTGMRRSELLALRWQDIDFIYSQIYISRGMHMLADNTMIFSQPKTAKSKRTVAMSPALFGVLHEYRQAREKEHELLGTPLPDNALVFSFLGKPMRPNTVSRAWHLLAVQAGVKPIRFHDGRHTHASLLLRQGVHPKVVQERLGHSTISVTLDTYSHVAPGMQEAAAKAFDDIAGIKHNSNALPKST